MTIDKNSNLCINYKQLEYALNEGSDCKKGIIAIISEEHMTGDTCGTRYSKEIEYCANAVTVGRVYDVPKGSKSKVIGILFISRYAGVRTLTFSLNPITRSFISEAISKASSIFDVYNMLQPYG